MPKVTYDQQVEMGLVKSGQGRRFRSAADVGLPVEPERRQATITAIEPAHVPIQRIEPVEPLAPRHNKPTVSGSHKDKAIAFRIATMPLAISFSLASAISLVALGYVPLFSMAILAVMFVTFAVAWLGGYIVNQIISPDGVGLASEYWRHKRLMNEQERIYSHLDRGQK